MLIPKVSRPRNIREFRPISLCNVLYKIIARCLSERLKIAMSVAISANQNAFVKGRQIGDNIVVGFEGIHTIKRNRFGNGGSATLKLDMAKA